MKSDHIASHGDSTTAEQFSNSTTRHMWRDEPPLIPHPAYATTRGQIYHSKIEQFLDSDDGKAVRGKVKLVFTSPPYPLNRKKKYGNLNGSEYVAWISSLAPRLSDLLTKDGSIVMEIGNSWEPGQPTMSTLAIEALLKFKEVGGLQLCQQFICYNPARLPSPAQWVNVERCRVKDSFTNIWWFSRTARPDASNKRVLKPYSPSMLGLLNRRKYNAGKRPSEHDIGAESFFKNHGGAIPSNVLTFANTSAGDAYLRHCARFGLQPHPARMPVGLAEFFIKFLTSPRNLVLDPFGGSNVTGAAAESLKRRWITVEASGHYIQGSLGRFGPVKVL
jgi:site-specific DNA-methyltransferase (cytosine-N4-specific)